MNVAVFAAAALISGLLISIAEFSILVEVGLLFLATIFWATLYEISNKL